MRIIKILGLFFLAKSLYARSYIAWVILLNGLVYHSYETVENYESKTSSILRNYDIASKALLTIYIAYYFPISRIYGIKFYLIFYHLYITYRY